MGILWKIVERRREAQFYYDECCVRVEFPLAKHWRELRIGN